MMKVCLNLDCGDRMKKILFVLDERKMGGVSILLEDILSKLNLEKFEVDVLILHNHGERLERLPSNVHLLSGTSYFNVIDQPLHDLIKRKNFILLWKKVALVFSLKTGFIMKKLVKERKKILTKEYDVEIAFKSGFCSIFTAVGNSKKKISWIHEDYRTNDATKKYHRLFEKVFSKMHAVVGITPDVVTAFQEKYPNCTNIMVIKNLVNTDKIIEKSQELVSFPKDKLTFISVGRLHEVKGYDRLIHACSRLVQEGIWKDSVLSIIGDGNEYETLHQLIQELNLQNKVYLLGRKDNPYAYMKQADLFLLSSRTEGFGNVMIESMILQVPVLATRVANIDETLRHETYGFIVKNSEEGIYQGLKNIFLYPELLTEKKRALKNYHYDNEQIMKQIEQLLEEQHEEIIN